MKPGVTVSAIGSLALLVVFSGTVFFRYVEGWTWVDAYYFTVVSVTTVGYGDPVPHTVLGKIGATVLIVVGIGVFALLATQIGQKLFDKRVAYLEEKQKREQANRNP